MTDNGVSTTTNYAGNFVYDGDDLQFFFHPEGYVNFVEGTTSSVRGSIGGQTTQSSYNYVFQYTDHLGNVRLSYEDKDKNGSVNASEIIEESHYYPFGLKQKGYNNVINGGNGLAQSWKYNGTEYEEALGLDLYEMDVRQYDPAIARWTGIDPVTHHSMSTYNAFDNNPVFWADPSGADGMSGIGGFSCDDCGSGTVRGSDMAEGALKGNDGYAGGNGETASETNSRKGIVNKFRMGLITGSYNPADWFVNKSGELVYREGHRDRSSEGLTWVGTDSSPKSYLRLIENVFGGDGKLGILNTLKYAQAAGSNFASNNAGNRLTYKTSEFATNYSNAFWLIAGPALDEYAAPRRELYKIYGSFGGASGGFSGYGIFANGLSDAITTLRASGTYKLMQYDSRLAHMATNFKNQTISTISQPFSKSNIGFSRQRNLMNYFGAQINYIKRIYNADINSVLNDKTINRAQKTFNLLKKFW